MLVTAIEKGKGSRWNVFVEGEFALSLDTQSFVTSSVKAGQEITPAQLDELRHMADTHRARERALYLLDMRSHTRRELQIKLARTVDADIAEETAGHMEEIGLVNDADYARRLTHSLAEQKGWGATRIRQKLFEKGVPREIAAEVLAELADTTDTNELLTALIRKKFMRKLAGARGTEKTIASLMRLGYKYSDIREALAGLADEYTVLADCDAIDDGFEVD